MVATGGLGRRAWEDVLTFPLPGRPSKPRRTGLTMVIDKGLGLLETRDLLHLAGESMDFLKLTFGTSAFYRRDLLQEKIGLCRAHGIEVFPGGTFLEVALVQGRLLPFLSRARELGFSYIEVSDGTVDLSQSERERAIRTAREFGFGVVSEVGKKDPADAVAMGRLAEQVALDLEAGAELVIVEGRESGQGVVIYDEQGRIKPGDLEQMAGAADPGLLLWEAPSKAQQQELILRFGPEVNLGNVAPGDVLALEALRVGLRGDTLRHALRRSGVTQVRAEAGHRPALQVLGGAQPEPDEEEC